jgi:hypothetical protein
MVSIAGIISITEQNIISLTEWVAETKSGLTNVTASKMNTAVFNNEMDKAFKMVQIHEEYGIV